MTPIGVRCDGDAAQVVKQFTPGTYINSSGYVDTKKMDIDETHTHIVNRIISTRLEIVGDIQPVKQ